MSVWSHVGPGMRMQELLWGVHLSFLCPQLVEFCGALGFRWVFLDAEHLPLSPTSAQELVRAADVAGMFCLVRLPRVDATLIQRFLDVGILGILAPKVASAADASALVKAVKFPPLGERGAAGRARAAGYGLLQSASDYYDAANRATFTAVLIETRAGIDNLDSILAVPGLDYAGIGANDLALSFAEPGREPRAPDIAELTARTRARINAAGKPMIMVVSSRKQAHEAASLGAGLVAVSDAVMLETAGREFLAAGAGKLSATEP